MLRRKYLLSAIVVLLLTISSSLIVPTQGAVAAPTEATVTASCSGSGCNGLDPVTTGCAGPFDSNLKVSTDIALIVLYTSLACPGVRYATVFQQPSNTQAVWLTDLGGNFISYTYRSGLGSRVIYSKMSYEPHGANACAFVDGATRCIGPN